MLMHKLCNTMGGIVQDASNVDSGKHLNRHRTRDQGLASGSEREKIAPKHCLAEWERDGRWQEKRGIK